MKFVRKMLGMIKVFIFNLKYQNRFKNQEFHYSFVCDNHKGLTFGKRVYIGPYCHFDAKGEIELQDFCIIAPHVKIWSYNHDFKDEMVPYGKRDIFKKVVVGKGSWIGLGATLLPGTVIGKGCVIGAGSIVSGVIPDFSMVRPNYSQHEPLTVSKNEDLYRREI
jgi:acetyltransferase-like isoleucine patch superfamily enzyme